jgi:glycosyltransferase involved in cell wall biosynthesis
VRKARGAAEKEFMSTETPRGRTVEPLASAPAVQPEGRTSAPPSLSVILPSYNHGQWLPRSLGALVAQAGPSTEIVLIDDGSTDNSAAVIADFCRRHDCIRLIRHDANRGTLAAVRTGIAAARGELVLFAAADDFVLPGLLARAEAALREHPDAAFFCSEVAVVDRARQVVGYRPVVPPRFTSGYVSPTAMRREIQRTDNWFFGPSVVYRRRLLAEIGYFDESLGTLCDGLAQRLLAFHHGFYFAAEILAVWMVDPQSLSAQTSMSVTESRRVIDAGTRWIGAHFPADVRDNYRTVFGRRLRFNMARQRLLGEKGRNGADGVCDLLGWGRHARTLTRFLHRVPLLGNVLVLALITLRMRPMSIPALVTSWWWKRVSQRGQRAAVEHRLADAGSPGLA